MGWVIGVIDACRANPTYNYAADHVEIILPAAAMLFLLSTRNFKGALTLGFGGVLCYANYYMFTRQVYFTLPPMYAVGLAAASVFVLVFLVYQFIQTA